MHILKINRTSIPYTIQRSKRARRRSIVMRAAGAEVILPWRVPEEKGHDFINRNRQWVVEQWQVVQTRLAAFNREIERDAGWQLSFAGIGYGQLAGNTWWFSGLWGRILFKGRNMPLYIHMDEDVRRVVIDYRERGKNQGFHVQVPTSMPLKERQPAIERAFKRWFKAYIVEQAEFLADQHARALKKRPQKFIVRQQKTRWGSCTHDGIVNLNLALARMPQKIFDYVVIHELCHLVHHDHSARYWGLVKRIMPDYKKAEDWLKDFGTLLLA